MKPSKVISFFLCLMIFVICGVLTAAIGYQLITHDEPCTLCFMQRICMLAIIAGALLNLRFGLKTKHFALSLLAALLGSSISIRQITLHICPGFPTFGTPVLGLSLYTWALIVFGCTILVTTVMLFTDSAFAKHKPHFGLFARSAFFYALIIAVANVVFALQDCGLGFCFDAGASC